MIKREINTTTSTLLYSNYRISFIVNTETSKFRGDNQRITVQQRLNQASIKQYMPLAKLHGSLTLISNLHELERYYKRFRTSISLLIKKTQQSCMVDSKAIKREFLQTQATVRTIDGIVLTNQESFEELNEESILGKLASMCNLLEVLQSSKIVDSSQVVRTPFIVLEQQPAGYLIHELFCHLLEADIFKITYERLMSQKITNKLSIMDDIRRFRTCFDLGGFDDCGNAISPTTLVEEGQIQSFLSHKPHLCIAGLHALGGNGRCENASFKVLPRMNFISTIFDNNYHIEESYLSKKSYLKVINAFSGYVNPITMEFSLHCSCIFVSQGTIRFYCPSIKFAGNAVDLINSFLFSVGSVASGLATCQKGNQSILVGWSSPGFVISSENIQIL